MSWLRLTATSDCFPHPYYTHTKCLSTLICCPWVYISSLTQLYPLYLTQNLGFLITCGVQMLSVRHGWDWQPPQIASCIHIKHIQSVWAHWYAVHRHTVSALHSYTHTYWLSFLGSGSLMESKCCHYIIVEADSHLKLLPLSMLDIYTVFEQIDMQSMYTVEALHSYPTNLA